jgi:hypothetical protein
MSAGSRPATMPRRIYTQSVHIITNVSYIYTGLVYTQDVQIIMLTR